MATGESTQVFKKENWQECQSSVQSTFLYLYHSKVLSDVVFLIEDEDKRQKQFFAHKFFLSARSAIFQSLFSCNNDAEIRISDISSQGFETMLRFLYTDGINLTSVQQAIDAFRAAKKYGLPFMEKQCQDYISSRITTESVCQIYELICKTEMSKILYECLVIISENPTKVFKSAGFIHCQLSTILMIVKRSNMALTSEYNLFTAIVNWSREECIRQNLDIENNLRNIIKPLLPHIRFLTMYPYEYAKIIDDTNLFDTSEAYAILLKILIPKATISLPKYLNCKLTPRNFLRYFTCRPFLSRNREPTETLKENDAFGVTFQILKSDIFILGITLSVLQQSRYIQKSELRTIIQIKLSSAKKSEEYLTEMKLNKYREPFLAFPYPVLIKEGETVNIKAQIQNVDKLAPMSIYRYQELVSKFRQNDAEFIFDYDNILETRETYQISSLHYYI
ncbi:BTB/POZ domain-containing protein 2-like [Centruroides vittatus]|uniref:BTB/POZ domain-containing protein 2-like n=1 Tax=Centruroides vittatus TaxID=120091 RepID=UPI00350EEB7E